VERTYAKKNTKCRLKSPNVERANVKIIIIKKNYPSASSNKKKKEKEKQKPVES